MVLLGGSKMSKSKGNIVDPDAIIKRYGADTTRLFVLFAAPPERDMEWSDAGVEGAFRFLTRVWRLVSETYTTTPGFAGARGSIDASKLDGPTRDLRRVTHQTIKRVSEDVKTRFNFNTAISAIMELVNAAYAYREKVPEGERSVEALAEMIEALVLMLAPFAPHVAEELWESIGRSESVHVQTWPAFDPEAVKTDEVEVVVQVNGKVRDRITVAADAAQDEVREKAMSSSKVQEFLVGLSVQNVIIVPKKLVNIVAR
jgi:leucyl-tRNA synthetase